MAPLMKELGVTQDKRQVRGVQCVKVDCLMVVTRQHYVNLDGLVGRCEVYPVQFIVQKNSTIFALCP